MSEKLPLYPQVATWLGIVSQLYDTRMTKLLSEYDLTLTQFALLNHLGRNQTSKHTISMLADALEVNQPGVTKIVKKMTGLGWVQVEKDEADSRKKYVSITKVGGEMIMTIQMALAPDVVPWFDEWNVDEMKDFLAHLQKLGGWLEQNKL